MRSRRVIGHCRNHARCLARRTHAQSRPSERSTSRRSATNAAMAAPPSTGTSNSNTLCDLRKGLRPQSAAAQRRPAQRGPHRAAPPGRRALRTVERPGRPLRLQLQARPSDAGSGPARGQPSATSTTVGSEAGQAPARWSEAATVVVKILLCGRAFTARLASRSSSARAVAEQHIVCRCTAYGSDMRAHH